MKSEKKLYWNLKIVDWHFDYARGVRYAIKGEQVELPTHVGDAFPDLFKRVEEDPRTEVVTTEKDIEVDETEEVVTGEEEIEIAEDEEVVVEESESTVESFEKALASGEVKVGRKYYTWGDLKIDIEEYDKAEDKSAVLE